MFFVEFPVHPPTSQTFDHCRQIEVLQEQAAKVTGESKNTLGNTDAATIELALA